MIFSSFEFARFTLAEYGRYDKSSLFDSHKFIDSR
jgi:hypothetical protein